ncbi:hypothetical protein [Sphaerimonospora thailandensis]|uniref:Uncharacterized protein n=1 Tax=Sphaerimonospora thailandensis TaxID=795644 RepID=A0A8J3R8U1_9ACTN|nr:hypothetical protein [Sphaerimonospora thailandensis]GIH69477.1 hypothetical protein Mth01_17300 [Sphaerimonospora thailandensis]
MSQIPAEAYPVAVYSGHRHATPDTIRVEVAESTVLLWIDGLMIGTPLDADDTRLRAAIDTAYATSQACERYAAIVRAELERRDRERATAPAEAALLAATHHHDTPMEDTDEH